MDRTNCYLYKHHLKIWGDKYPCTAEEKGGVIPLYHHLFIVTSNLSIEDMFAPDTESRTTKQQQTDNEFIAAIK